MTALFGSGRQARLVLGDNDSIGTWMSREEKREEGPTSTTKSQSIRIYKEEVRKNRSSSD